MGVRRIKALDQEGRYFMINKSNFCTIREVKLHRLPNLTIKNEQ